MQLANAAVRFVPPTDSRGDGLSAVGLQASDPERGLETARTMGAVDADGDVMVCGTSFRLAR